MFNKINDFFKKKWKNLKYEFISGLYVSLFVVMAYLATNPVLTILDDKYGLNNYVWFGLSHIFKVMPFVYDQYKRYGDKCNKKKYTVLQKIYYSVKSSLFTVAMIEIGLFILGYVPVIGNIISMFGYIPLIGEPALFIAGYLFIIINKHLNPFYYLQEQLFFYLFNKLLGIKFGDCEEPYLVLAGGGLVGSGLLYIVNEVMELSPF
tara:strand:+ start:412 stop:1029 length:618 start_codon:yes stop_codon:yes gene_type:complete